MKFTTTKQVEEVLEIDLSTPVYLNLHDAIYCKFEDKNSTVFITRLSLVTDVFELCHRQALKSEISDLHSAMNDESDFDKTDETAFNSAYFEALSKTGISKS